MSAENVTAAKEALAKVLEDVKNKLGDEPVAKIAYIGYRARTDKLTEELGYLEESFFDVMDEPGEDEDEAPRSKKVSKKKSKKKKTKKKVSKKRRTK